MKMDRWLSMDKSYLLNLCSLARKKAHNYHDIMELSFADDDRDALALSEIEGIRDCLARALELADKIIKEST